MYCIFFFGGGGRKWLFTMSNRALCFERRGMERKREKERRRKK